MFLTAVIIGLMVGLAIAAIILTSACSLVRVQPPDFFFAMVLCVVIGTVVCIIQFAAGLAGTLGAGISLTSLTTVVEFQKLMQRGVIVGTLFTPFVSAGIYSAALPECSYKRGLLIWVAQFVVIALILVGIWATVSGLGLTGKH